MGEGGELNCAWSLLLCFGDEDILDDDGDRDVCPILRRFSAAVDVRGGWLAALSEE